MSNTEVKMTVKSGLYSGTMAIALLLWAPASHAVNATDTRVVYCKDGAGNPVPEELCNPATKPAATQVGASCDPTVLTVLTEWATGVNKTGLVSAPVPSNCSSGYVQTEVLDDGNARHSVAEENDGGDDDKLPKFDRQLCLKIDGTAARMVSAWVPVAQPCPANTVDTTIRDDQGKYDFNEDPYYLHGVNEEDFRGIDNYWKWCLGAEAPLSTVVTWRSGACIAGETLLFHGHNNERNFNNEDGSDNSSLCVRVQ